MWNQIKQRLMYGWTLRRGIGLGIGLLFLAQALAFKEIPAGFFAAIFLTQSLANVGCFGSGCCATAMDSKADGKTADISYTEIK